MKIGMLTLYQSDSFGAVLQSYALLRAFSGPDVSCELISLKTQEETKSQKPDRTTPLERLVNRENRNRAKLFQQFREEHLWVSPAYFPEEIPHLSEKYDAFVVGSDQVWNPEIPEVDSRYFLPFAQDCQKFSYAASFGVRSISPQCREYVCRYLKSFRTLSVRENSGKDILLNELGRKGKVHLDPALLLQPEDWKKLMLPMPEEEPYLLVCFLIYQPEMIQYAEKYASDYHLNIRYISSSFNIHIKITDWSRVSVSDWLNAICHADAVITDSFHCTVFSILWDRPFAVFPLKGNLAARNERLYSLLDMTDLSYNIKTIADHEPAKKANTVLSYERKKSLQYIQTIIDEIRSENL